MQGFMRTFWIGLLAAFVVTLLLGVTGTAALIPFVDPLIQRGGTGAVIATLVLMVTVWILIVVVLRARSIIAERIKLTNTEKVLKDASGHDPERIVGTIQRQFTSDSTSLLRGRFELLRRPMRENDREMSVFVLAGQSSLDSAHSEVNYGPLRALIYALPALGFLGTASEVAIAVGELGSAIGSTSGYGDLRNLLVQDVTPPLANAFGVTLLALSGTVVCHFLVNLLHASEQRVLLQADKIALDFASKILETRRGSEVTDLPVLNKNMLWLAEKVNDLNESVKHSTSALDGSASLGNTVVAMSGQLDAISSKMDREVVLRPMSTGLSSSRNQTRDGQR